MTPTSSQRRNKTKLFLALSSLSLILLPLLGASPATGVSAISGCATTSAPTGVCSGGIACAQLASACSQWCQNTYVCNGFESQAVCVTYCTTQTQSDVCKDSFSVMVNCLAPVETCQTDSVGDHLAFIPTDPNTNQQYCVPQQGSYEVCETAAQTVTPTPSGTPTPAAPAVSASTSAQSH